MELYYTPPSEEIFDEVKEQAMKLWHEVDEDHDKYGYATEKVNRIKDIPNVADNVMYIVAMFDQGNQRKLSLNLSPEANEAIRDRLKEGGMPDYANPF